MSHPVIEVRYRCTCLLEEATVEVPPRREDEDVVHWVQQVAAMAIYLDHRKRSPTCLREAMEYVKIPAPENAPFIGGTPKMDS